MKIGDRVRAVTKNKIGIIASFGSVRTEGGLERGAWVDLLDEPGIQEHFISDELEVIEND